ncbi:hypothetical protein EIK77_000083 [Talaromyces pinophilus]|nr:hypothetical protein EIK77_000083 [Talaromyces pinophilus]
MNAIRNILSEITCTLIEKSPRRVYESSTQSFQTKTECVRMKIPRQNYQDAILSLEVGIDDESEVLFKSIFKDWMLHRDSSRKSQSGSITSFNLQNSGHGVLKLENAFAPAITTFGSRVDNAVRESQLRENENASEYTQCLAMDLHPQTYHGVIHIRVGFMAGTHMASQLYR